MNWAFQSWGREEGFLRSEALVQEFVDQRILRLVSCRGADVQIVRASECCADKDHIHHDQSQSDRLAFETLNDAGRNFGAFFDRTGVHLAIRKIIAWLRGSLTTLK